MKSLRKPYTSPVIKVDQFTLGVYGDYGNHGGDGLHYSHPHSSGDNPFQLNQD